MLIDWFTVGAQALNFLILVWLLKHFLYKPVLSAIDAREKHIAAELADAAAKKAAAEGERDDLQNKNKVFDEQRVALMAAAAGEAKASGELLLANAHREADSLRKQQADLLQSDQQRLGQQITRLLTQEVLAIARKALTDLAAANLEERMGEVFTRRLREMDGKARQQLATALTLSSEPAVVRSSFALPPPVRATIQNALNETFRAEVRLQFETAPNIISGIELTAGGQRLAWSIAEYLSTLERQIGLLLSAQAAPAQAIRAPQAVPTVKAPIKEAS